MPRSISDFVTSALVGKLRTYRNSELMQIIIGLTDWMVLKKHWIQGGKLWAMISEEMMDVVEFILGLDG